MSAAPVFYLKTHVAAPELQREVSRRWEGILCPGTFGYSSGVLLENTGHNSVSLNHFFGHEGKVETAREVIRHLFVVAEGVALLYARNHDGGMRPGENDHPTTIKVEDILPGDLRPGYFNGPQFCYPLLP